MAAANMELFDQYFNRADLDRDGRISGAEAIAFFQGPNLPKQVLAQLKPFASSSSRSPPLVVCKIQEVSDGQWNGQYMVCLQGIPIQMNNCEVRHDWTEKILSHDISTSSGGAQELDGLLPFPSDMFLPSVLVPVPVLVHWGLLFLPHRKLLSVC